MNNRESFELKVLFLILHPLSKIALFISPLYPKESEEISSGRPPKYVLCSEANNMVGQSTDCDIMFLMPSAPQPINNKKTKIR